jgi:hypothetical protein
MASNGALCSFDVDHLFPWSRGGRSVMQNFVACQSRVNRQVKCDKLIQQLSLKEMNCEITPEQFKNLVSYAETKESDGRRTSQHNVDKVIKGWLLWSPTNHHELGNFQE